MAPWLWLRTWLCVNALLLPLFGCSRQQPPGTAEAALRRLGAALAEDRLEDAYALLSEAQKSNLDRAEFISNIKDNEQESKVLSRSAGASPVVRVQAIVELADGRRVRLVQEAGGFRIDEPIATFYPTATPRDALRSFVQAIEARRWNVLLGLMPNADRADLEATTLAERIAPHLEEVTRLAALLATHLEAPIEVIGDRAVMPYGGGATMRFVRESDGWKVEDPE